jgi:RHS repeat-associated protein
MSAALKLHTEKNPIAWKVIRNSGNNNFEELDYYPFGAQMEGRHGGTNDTRYGFVGMEKDDELYGDGNSYDFGARMYNPRIGRWMSVDPLAAKYSGLSPFQYAGNTPISAYDPDGRLIIFINGETGELEGSQSNGSHPERASILYWSWKFISQVTSAFNDNNYIYLDGDVGTGQTTRFDKGYAQAKADFKTILSQLKKDENGKINETVKLISHSKGTAYAAGYQKAWNEMMANEDQSQFSENGGQIEFSLMLAPHQSWAMEVTPSSTVTVGISHDWDPLSDDGVDGDLTQIQTDNYAGVFGAGKAHTIDGFHFEAVAAIKTFIEKKKEGELLGIWEAIESGSICNYKNYGFDAPVENAKKWVWNREKQTYEGHPDDN